jgi:L-lactate dehydrogenase
MLKRESFKVAIVGLGKVGMTTAYAILNTCQVTELLLYSRDLEKAEGEKLDLEHGSPFFHGTEVLATDNFTDFKGVDLTIVTAGCAQKPGETRLDLVRTNSQIIQEIIPQIAQAAPQGLIMLVTNPVDILTHLAQKLANLPEGRVFGSGTLLDTARFRVHLAEYVSVNPTSIHTYILGEHGDTSFPAVSASSIGGLPLSLYPGFSAKIAEEAYQKTKDAAYQIIKAKGATYYGIATAITHIVKTIMRDGKKVIPLSVPLENYYGIGGVSLSVPCIVGRNGIIEKIKIPLNEDEQTKLHNSASTLKSYLT